MHNFKIIMLTTLIYGFLALGVNKSVIVIDAGHGGWDPGKVSSCGEEEHAINLAISDFLQQHLETSGAIVFRTRSEDAALGDTKRTDMRARADMPAQMQADLFISIHQNAFTKENVKGAQTFYYEGSEISKQLAEAIQARIKSSLDTQNRMEAKGNDSYFVLKETGTPAVLVECGFLTNPDELSKLKTEEYQQKVAWAIFLGISDFLEAKPLPS